jgi:hypothetical protein
MEEGLDPIHIHWQERVVAAARAYTAARASTEKVMRERIDSPGADESQVVAEALRSEESARRQYREVLDIFSQLVLHGIRPPGA